MGPLNNWEIGNKLAHPTLVNDIKPKFENGTIRRYNDDFSKIVIFLPSRNQSQKGMFFKKFAQRKVLCLPSFCELGIPFLLTFPESPCSTTIQTMILLCWESICATITLSLYETPKHHSTLLILTKPNLCEKNNRLLYW